MQVPAAQIAQFDAAPTSDRAWKMTQQGAAAFVLLATSPLLDGIGDRSFAGCHEAGPHVSGTQTGVAAYALDPEAAAHLWQGSIAPLAAGCGCIYGYRGTMQTRPLMRARSEKWFAPKGVANAQRKDPEIHEHAGLGAGCRRVINRSVPCSPVSRNS